MLRKLFLLLSGLAAAAVGLVVWTKRDELKDEIERARGEWRAGPGAGGGAAAPSNGGAAASGPRAAGRANGRPAPGSRSAPVGPRPVPGAAAAAAQPQRCVATTRSGSRCTRDAEPGSDRCWQHAG